MVATISNREFYSGNPLYSLKAAVSHAGGTIAQFDLFKYLLTSSLTGVPKATSGSSPVTMHDCRAAASLLFLFPPRTQMALAVMLYVREMEIQEELSGHYNLTSQIANPAEVMRLHQQITSPLGFTFLSALASLDIQGLQKLLQLDVNLTDTQRPLRQRLETLIPSEEEFIDLAVTNDRYKAAILMAERLNYRQSSIQAIASITELWLLQNSSI